METGSAESMWTVDGEGVIADVVVLAPMDEVVDVTGG